MIESFDYQQLSYATDGFSSSKLIGKGSHGSVYKAILDDNSVVAVKKPLLQNNNKLDNEATILSSLPQNPLVVNFLGTSVDSLNLNNKLLVMEFMSNGTLHDLLLSPKHLTWPKRHHIITQIARALHFLHQANPLVIHRDIKAENILFDSNWNLKLADFGLAVYDGGAAGQPAGTIGYLDPSYTTPGKLSTKSDVFSFGVVLLEVISGRKAMDVSNSPASVVDWATPLIQRRDFQRIYDGRIGLPKYLEGRTRKLLDLAGRCVCGEQGKRPSMAEILHAMESTSSCIIQPLSFFPAVWSTLLLNLVKGTKRFRRRQTVKLFKETTTIWLPSVSKNNYLIEK